MQKKSIILKCVGFKKFLAFRKEDHSRKKTVPLPMTNTSLGRQFFARLHGVNDPIVTLGDNSKEKILVVKEYNLVNYIVTQAAPFIFAAYQIEISL